MIFGKRSDLELKYARAKAKVTEFRVDPRAVPQFKLNSDELHYTSVLTLSTYVNAKILGHNSACYLRDLQKVASFYDSASNDMRYVDYSDGYWLLAMATYFLLGNYGSAKVCAEKVQDPGFYGSRARTLHSLILFLLAPLRPRPSNLTAFVGFVEGRDVNVNEVIREASFLRSQANPEDAFFGDILYVSILDAIAYSARTLLPDYSNLSLDKWGQFLTKQSAPKLLWQAQRQIGSAGVFAGNNAFIQLPTGSGKTKSVELLLRSRMLSNHCRLAVVVAPYRALCSEITRSLATALRDVARVNLASEVMEIDSWLEESAAGCRVVIATPEKLGFIIHHDSSLLKDSDLFVFDEAHLLDSESRGPGYELLLTEIFAMNPEAQKVMISAVVSNADEIARWAFGDSGRIAKGGAIQVTEKSIGLIQNKGSRVSYATRGDIANEEFFVPIDVKPQELQLRGRERNPRFFPDFSGNQARDLAIYYANRLLPNGACAIYVPRKASIPPILNRLKELAQRGADLSNLRSSILGDEKRKLFKLISMHYGKSNIISPCIDVGVLPHYGALQGSIGQAVEYEVEHGHAKCIICTSTLSEGVNLPIKYLIVTGARRGYETPRTRDFLNLIGRAARSGKFSEGSVLIVDDTSRSRKRMMYSSLMDGEKTERCESAIINLLSDVLTWNGGAVAIPGSTIIDYILENLADPQLEHKLTGVFLDLLKCDESRARILASRRIRPLEAIESYLSGVMAANLGDADVAGLCASTYAYATADDEMRERLAKLFKAIYKSLNFACKERAALYHMMQVGSRNALSIIEWIESHEGRRFIESGCSEVELAVHQFRLSNSSIADMLDDRQLSTIIRLWTDGADLARITECVNKRFCVHPALQVGKIEKIVSSEISFNFSHFVSCILDAVKHCDTMSSTTNIDNLSAFQRKVRYGVSTLSEAVICEEVIDDRMIARELIAILGVSNQVDGDRTFLKLKALTKKGEVERFANSLPAYCSKRINDWIGSK